MFSNCPLRKKTSPEQKDEKKKKEKWNAQMYHSKKYNENFQNVLIVLRK